MSFCSFTKGITPKIGWFCLVLINSVLLNLLCVWILFQNASRPVTLVSDFSLSQFLCCAVGYYCCLMTCAFSLVQDLLFVCLFVIVVVVLFCVCFKFPFCFVLFFVLLLFLVCSLLLERFIFCFCCCLFVCCCFGPEADLVFWLTWRGGYPTPLMISRTIHGSDPPPPTSNTQRNRQDSNF